MNQIPKKLLTAALAAMASLGAMAVKTDFVAVPSGDHATGGAYNAAVSTDVSKEFVADSTAKSEYTEEGKWRVYARVYAPAGIKPDVLAACVFEDGSAVKWSEDTTTAGYRGRSYYEFSHEVAIADLINANKHHATGKDLAKLANSVTIKWTEDGKTFAKDDVCTYTIRFDLETFRCKYPSGSYAWNPSSKFDSKWVLPSPLNRPGMTIGTSEDGLKGHRLTFTEGNITSNAIRWNDAQKYGAVDAMIEFTTSDFYGTATSAVVNVRFGQKYWSHAHYLHSQDHTSFMTFPRTGKSGPFSAQITWSHVDIVPTPARLGISRMNGHDYVVYGNYDFNSNCVYRADGTFELVFDPNTIVITNRTMGAIDYSPAMLADDRLEPVLWPNATQVPVPEGRKVTFSRDCFGDDSGEWYSSVRIYAPEWVASNGTVYVDGKAVKAAYDEKAGRAYIEVKTAPADPKALLASENGLFQELRVIWSDKVLDESVIYTFEFKKDLILYSDRYHDEIAYSPAAVVADELGELGDVDFNPGIGDMHDCIYLTLNDNNSGFVLDTGLGNKTQLAVDLNDKTIAPDPAADPSGEPLITIAAGTSACLFNDGLIAGERTVGEEGFDLETRPAAILVEGELVIEGGTYNAEIIVADGAKLEIRAGRFRNSHDELWGTDRPAVSYAGDPNVILAPGTEWQQGADGYWSLVDAKVVELDGVEYTLMGIREKLDNEICVGSDAKPVKLIRDLRLRAPLHLASGSMLCFDLNGFTLACANRVAVTAQGTFILYDSVGGGKIDGLVNANEPGMFNFKGGRFLDSVEGSGVVFDAGKRLVRDNEGYLAIVDEVDSKKASKDPYERIEDELIPLDEYYGPYVPGVAVAFTNETLIDCAVSGLSFGIKFDKKTGAFSGTPTKPGVYKVTFTKTVKDEATKRSVSHKATTTFLVDSLRKVTVVAAGAGQGKATPAEKELAAGKTVALKATAEKGSVFGGWYVKGECVSREANYTYTAGEDAEQLVLAQFIKAKQDVAAAIRVGEVGADGASTIIDRLEVQHLYVGVPVVYDLKTMANSATRIQVLGLQGGLVYDRGTGLISGIPTAAKSFTATIKVANVSKMYSEYGMAFELTALPDWAVGSFDGAYMGHGATPDAAANVQGAVSFTVTKSGAVSGKVTTGGKSYAFSAKSFDEYDAETDAFKVRVSPKAGKVALGELELAVSATEDGVGSVRGVFAADEQEGMRFAHLVQNVWKRTDAIRYDVPTFPTGRKAISVELANGLVARLGVKGAVSVAGKITGDDGRDLSVSATAQLLAGLYDPETGVNAQFVLYVPPKANLFAGFCELVSLKLTVDENNVVTIAEEYQEPEFVLLTAETLSLLPDLDHVIPVTEEEVIAFLKTNVTPGRLSKSMVIVGVGEYDGNRFYACKCPLTGDVNDCNDILNNDIVQDIGIYDIYFKPAE